MMRILLTLLSFLALLLFSISIPLADTALYLKGDGLPIASLSSTAPTTGILPNYDPGRDAFPGLVIYKGGSGMFENDPNKYQQWITSPTGVSLDGPISFIFWSGMENFEVGKRGIVNAFLLDCDEFGSDCSLIAQNQKDIFDWSGGWSSWNKHSIEFGNIAYVVPEGRSLSVKIVVSTDSDDDMWFAYDSTSYPSTITDQYESDIVIDCDFSDWCDGDGNEFCVDDQGGPNDWESPAKLDITKFAVSSNLIDAFHLFVGFDDVPPQSTTAATLIDTDLDNNINFALVTTLDDSLSTVELYSCDDTITDGCSGNVLERVYPQSYYCVGNAQGPWDNDTFMEFVLPFNDIGIENPDAIFLSSLVSYAAAALLTSPKDSIYGTEDQYYLNGIFYNTIDGSAQATGPIGSNFLIRRDTDPYSVRTAEVHATVPQAPFDDLPGSLDDGVSYFYVVEKEGGIPLALSVNSNPYENAIRIGFNDHNPLSASVDSSQSIVSLDISSIPADGSSAITVTVVPYESNGIPIGSGCDISVDEIQLSPGNLAGPVKDNYDGSYTFKVVSLSSGNAVVAVEVEGIVLDSQPEVTFSIHSPDMAPQSLSHDFNSADDANSAIYMNSNTDMNKNDRDTFNDDSKSPKGWSHR